MQVAYTIILMRDTYGGEAFAVVTDKSDRVQVANLRGADGESAFFEAEVYDLPDFCREYDIILRHIKIDEAFNTLWEKAHYGGGRIDDRTRHYTET